MTPIAQAIRRLIAGAETAAHAPLPASSAYRWRPCPGSVGMSALYPEEGETEEAREGTAGHWAATEEAAGRGVTEGQVTPDGWVLDDDQAHGAELFAQHLPPQIMAVAHLEQRVHMGALIHEHNWGTPDLYALDRPTRTAYVSDYKYGHGIVEVFENDQLVDYAAALAPITGPGWTFEFAIVQPRVWHRDGHVRRWRATYEQLQPLWQSLSYAAEEALSDDPRLQPGPWCKHCPAAHACPALNGDVSQIAPVLERAAPLELPDHAMGFELRKLYRMQQLLNARIAGLEVEAESRLRKGARLPWLALESKPGREKWKVPDAGVIEIGKMYGLNLAKAVTAATPRQARDAGLPAAVAKALAERDSTSAKLAVVEARDVRRVFTMQEVTR